MLITCWLLLLLLLFPLIFRELYVIWVTKWKFLQIKFELNTWFIKQEENSTELEGPQFWYSCIKGGCQKSTKDVSQGEILWIAKYPSLPFSSHYFNVTGQSISILTNIFIIYYTFVMSVSHLTMSKPYVYYALLNSLKVLSLFEKLFICSTVIWVEQSHMIVCRTGFKNSLEILNPEASTGAQFLASISFA